MNITYDKSLKQRVWQAINRKIEDKTCPFCGVKLSAKNFAGAAWIGDEFRAFDGNIVCLIEFSDTMRDAKEEEE